MTRERFEEVAQHAFDSLPEKFRHNVENVQIVVEDYPSTDARARTGSNRHGLLGLYQGVPLPHRGTSYGMYPVGPDKITLYQANIEGTCTTEDQIERRIVEVLFHELGHYFGMNEREVRDALKDFE
ncbi:MAG: metallopeptidase family protein [Ignavibacteriales bacterium]|nr:metallopeptidase family protein [Ignavibacteriales bacterium]